MTFSIKISVALLLVGVVLAPPACVPDATGERPATGDDPYGTKFSSLDDLDRSNVADLALAWTYSTDESEVETRNVPRLSATPVVMNGVMYVGTPLGRIVALDPETGAELWVFDAEVDPAENYGDFTNRGVATWVDAEAPEDTACRRRVFLGTIDARLVAVDGGTGQPCSDFGREGEVDLREGLRIPPISFPAYQVTSPPAVVDDLVITGSAIADNTHIAPASGEVRAWDARTGELRWSWDPVPQNPEDPAFETWDPAPDQDQSAAANVWSLMSVDPERGLVFAPTTSPSPDYYGGLRRGRNQHASSIVALNTATGDVAWSFQTVRHDLWDYDNPAQPALVTLNREGREIPAVLAVTKTGQLFVLHRETGEPIFAVEERPVPQSDIPGEETWPTQVFNREIEPLSPQSLSLDEVWGATVEDRDACQAQISELRNEGIYTPPSFEGSVVIPSNIGGAHWGGLAFDPERQLAVIPVNRIAAMVQLIPQEDFDRQAAEAESERLGVQEEFTVMRGTPYVMRRRLLLSSSGLPCTPPPFGALVAVDLQTGQRVWEVPLGDPMGESGPEGDPLGMINLGGPIATAGGIAFIGATLDRRFRAFDTATGEELWSAPLPGWGRATPMTYRGESTGKQYVAIASYGPDGHHIVAFALPEPNRVR